jgi:uncharacterized protein
MAATLRLEKNRSVPGSAGRPMATDVAFRENRRRKPVVVYVHGFNGFKDWGNFDLIARQFAEAGFVFVKFNLSHNGTRPESPEEFTDLEAYGRDNSSIQLADLGFVLDWICAADNPFAREIDAAEIGLLGHSRGGGNVILKAAEDARVKCVVTWASVAEAKTPWGSWPPERLDAWRESGVDYTENSRTQQRLPHYYQLYEDFAANSARLDIHAAVARLTQPLLLIHGRQDSAVPAEKALFLNMLQPAAELFLLDTDHVFGRRHPWAEEALPGPAQEAVDRSIGFFRKWL